MASDATPRVTISLVTYNGEAWLTGCLASVREQELTDFELRVVDNASTDRTVEFLREAAANDPRTTLTELDSNRGFAAAHNLNLMSTESELVMLLNQDVELDPGFLLAAVRAFDRRPRAGAVQGRLRRLSGPDERTTVLDSTGLVMHRDRRVVARRQGEIEDERDLIAGPVWGVDGPAPVYRRAALRDVTEPRTGGGREVLDEDFFMYKEDVDLAWRLRKRGWTTWYEPSALAWHGRGAVGGGSRTIIELMQSRHVIPRWIQVVSWRNHRLMQLKNETIAEYLRDLPWTGRREVLSLGFMALTDPKRLSVVGALLVSAPTCLRKRRSRQARSRSQAYHLLEDRHRRMVLT